MKNFGLLAGFEVRFLNPIKLNPFVNLSARNGLGSISTIKNSLADLLFTNGAKSNFM